MLQESLNVTSRSLQDKDVPLLLPASLKAAKLLMIPKTSCERIVETFPC